MGRNNRFGENFRRKTFLDWEHCFDMMRVVRLWNNDYLRVLLLSREAYFNDKGLSGANRRIDNPSISAAHRNILSRNGYGFPVLDIPDDVYMRAGAGNRHQGYFASQAGRFLVKLILEDESGQPVSNPLSESRRTNCFSAPKQGFLLGLVRQYQPHLRIEGSSLGDAASGGRISYDAPFADSYEVLLAPGDASARFFPDRMGTVIGPMLGCIEFANVAEVVKYNNFWQHSLLDVQESIRPGDLGGLGWANGGGHSVFIYQVRYDARVAPNGSVQGYTWFQILSSQGQGTVDAAGNRPTQGSDGTGVAGINNNAPDYLGFRGFDDGAWYCLESGASSKGWSKTGNANHSSPALAPQGPENGAPGVRDSRAALESAEPKMAAVFCCRFWRLPRVAFRGRLSTSSLQLRDRQGGAGGAVLPAPATVEEPAIDDCAASISSDEGAYPFGAFGNEGPIWHNGQHFQIGPEAPVYAVADGVIVGFRFEPESHTRSSRSRNFILVRHDLPNYRVTEYGARPFFSLYMHLADESYRSDAPPFEHLYWRGYALRLFPYGLPVGEVVFHCNQRGARNRNLRLRVQSGERLGKVSAEGILHLEIFTAEGTKLFEPEGGTYVDIRDARDQLNPSHSTLAEIRDRDLEHHFRPGAPARNGRWYMRCEHISEWVDPDLRPQDTLLRAAEEEAREFFWLDQRAIEAIGMPGFRVTTYHPMQFLLSLKDAMVCQQDEGQPATAPRDPPELRSI